MLKRTTTTTTENQDMSNSASHSDSDLVPISSRDLSTVAGGENQNEGVGRWVGRQYGQVVGATVGGIADLAVGSPGYKLGRMARGDNEPQWFPLANQAAAKFGEVGGNVGNWLTRGQ